MISYKWTPIQPLKAGAQEYDFSEIDSLQRQWIEVKTRVESSTPHAYGEFMEQLGRSWAIETGIIEGLYSLDRGVTKTLVEKGIIADYIERSSTNKDPLELIEILKDHQSSIEFVNYWIREGRPLTKWFIEALHQAITKNQYTFKAIDQFGNAFDTKLLKGEFKKFPNNPTRPDGSIHEYCPPEQVESELDNLLHWYEQQRGNCHPLLLSVWLHHRFTQIHPFQDGNGRVVRAILTWHLVRERFLPVVIPREKRSEYIDALEIADKGNLTPHIELIVQLEKTTILQALSAGEPVRAETEEPALVDQVIDHLVERIERHKKQQVEQMRSVNQIAEGLRQAAREYLEPIARETTEKLRDRAGVSITPQLLEGGPDRENEHWYRAQVTDTARNSQHWVNFTEQRYFIRLSLKPSPGSRNPRLVFVISLHHVGRQLTGTIAATAFAEIEYYPVADDSSEPGEQRRSELFRDCTVSPLTFTWKDSLEKIRPRFDKWTERCFSVALAYWGEFLAESPEG